MSRLAVATVFAAALSLAACNKAPAPPASPAPPAPPAAVAPPAAPTLAKRGGELTISSADLGTDLGADGRIVTATDGFAPGDTVIVAITTTNSGSAPLNAQITARWLDPAGAVLNEESRQQDFTGTQTVNFRIANPKGFEPGNYKLEVALNGSTVQMRPFTIH